MDGQLRAARGKNPWSESEIAKLVQGVAKFGAGKWVQIKAEFPCFDGRIGCDLKDKYRWIKARDERLARQRGEEPIDEKAKKKPKTEPAAASKAKAPRKRTPPTQTSSAPCGQSESMVVTGGVEEPEAAVEFEYELDLVTENPHHVEVFGQWLTPEEEITLDSAANHSGAAAANETKKEDANAAPKEEAAPEQEVLTLFEDADADAAVVPSLAMSIDPMSMMIHESAQPLGRADNSSAGGHEPIIEKKPVAAEMGGVPKDAAGEAFGDAEQHLQGSELDDVPRWPEWGILPDSQGRSKRANTRFGD